MARIGPGHPRKRPDHVTADEAYSHPSTRRVTHSIPEESDRIAYRLAEGSRGARPPALDRERHAGRNVVDRCFNRLEQFRALATRYARRAGHYRATVLLAATIFWPR